jgi:ABC-2 type transport system ATP-binding protein
MIFKIRNGGKLMGVLKCESVYKTINKKNILTNITFDLKEGEIVGLVGPNGAGKTTLMKLMVGLSSVSRGKITLNKKDVKNDFLDYIKNVGCIIEVPNFYPSLSGYECLVYYAKLRNVPKSSLEDVIELVGLKKSISNKVKTYSLGMKQRLGIAQAIITNPKLLILDEPFNGLDPNGVKDLRDVLIKTKENNSTTFISSHTLSELEMICDKVIFMNRGEIVKIENLHKDKILSGMLMTLDTVDNNKAFKIIQNEFTSIDSEISNNIIYLKDVTPNIFADVLLCIKENKIEIIKFEEIKESLQKSFETLIGKGEKSE